MEDVIKKAKPIRLIIFDVDGVLTGGSLFYGPSGLELKEFHVPDGQGIKFLQKSQVDIGVITACRSSAITHRLQDLGIQHVYQGAFDKIPAYEDLKQKLNLEDTQIAYMGDDLPDLPLIIRAGLGISVPNGTSIVQQHADWVTKAPGGKGAVREVCELIMRAQDQYDVLLNSYLQDGNVISENRHS